MDKTFSTPTICRSFMSSSGSPWPASPCSPSASGAATTIGHRRSTFPQRNPGARSPRLYKGHREQIPADGSPPPLHTSRAPPVTHHRDMPAGRMRSARRNKGYSDLKLSSGQVVHPTEGFVKKKLVVFRAGALGIIGKGGVCKHVCRYGLSSQVEFKLRRAGTF